MPEAVRYNPRTNCGLDCTLESAEDKMRASNKLSALTVKRLTKVGRYADGGGLYLQVSKYGTKAWLFRYMLDGRARQMGLGSIDTFSLKEARERARRARQQIFDGVDPIEARRKLRESAKIADARGTTFRDAAERYISAHRAGWKNAKHTEQWTNSLRTYVYPALGDLPVAGVDTGLVLKVLEPIWTEKTETASRVRGRIESILDWAKARGYRAGENPARWRGHIDKLLPAKTKVAKVQHFKAMPYEELPAFMEKLRRSNSIPARALEFTILTGARTGEVLGATWGEIDFKAKVWTVPGTRTKSDREHRVPLSDRALEILEKMPREGDGTGFVFPGARANAPLSNMAMLELLRGMEGNGLTVHGFRSTFRD